MEDQLNANTETFIPKKYQQSLALEEDEILEDAHLTKGVRALPTA